MQKDLLATDQDDLGLLSRSLVFQSSHQIQCSHFTTLQRAYHLVMHRRVECRHQSVLALLTLQPFDVRDVLKAENHTIFIIEAHLRASDDQSLVFT